MSYEHVEKLIKDHKAEYVDLRFVDMRGVQQHVTFPASIVDASLFGSGTGWALPVTNHTLQITLGGIADNAVSRRYCSASGGRKSSAAGTGNRDSTTARP